MIPIGPSRKHKVRSDDGPEVFTEEEELENEIEDFGYGKPDDVIDLDAEDEAREWVDVREPGDMGPEGENDAHDDDFDPRGFCSL